MPDWCMVYKNWATALTGYHTVIDCKPVEDEEPSRVIQELYILLQEYTGGGEGLPKPEAQHPELIGQRYLVYKAVGGDWRKPVYELRSVYDKEEDKLIWTGGVYASIIPGAPDKPPRQPILPEPPVNLDPPPSPKGQKKIRKPVVYSAEGPFPEIKRNTVRLGVYDEHAPKFNAEIDPGRDSLSHLISDFHCVTGWSVGGIEWRGIPLLDLLREHGLRGDWILTVSHGGYTTIVPYDERILEDAFLVTHLGNERLPTEHGGPYRIVFPKLYGWKSLKWVDSILVGPVYLDGYWEARGYHWRGLVVLDERFKRY